MIGVWLAVKAFAGPLLEGLWRVLTDWRVLAPLIAAVVLWGTYSRGIEAGLAEAKVERQSEIIAAQSTRLTANDDTFKRLEKRLADIEKQGADRALKEAARANALEAFKQEILNAPDPRCILTDRDVRLLDTLNTPAAAKPGG